MVIETFRVLPLEDYFSGRLIFIVAQVFPRVPCVPLDC